MKETFENDLAAASKKELHAQKDYLVAGKEACEEIFICWTVAGDDSLVDLKRISHRRLQIPFEEKLRTKLDSLAIKKRKIEPSFIPEAPRLRIIASWPIATVGL